MRQALLNSHRVYTALRYLCRETLYLVIRHVGQQLQVRDDHVVVDGHRLTVHLGRRIGHADIVAQAFAHLLHAVRADEQRHEKHLLGFLSHRFL